MKTVIERGKAESFKGNFSLVETIFKLTKVPGVARRHLWARGDLNSMRFLPVNEDIEAPEGTPLPIELLYQLIEEASHRVIVDYCICRKSCDCKSYPVSTGCIVLGDAAMEIAPTVRREVDPREAKAHAQAAVVEGLIPFIGKVRIDNLLYGIKDHGRFITVCFCCECCCVSRFTRHIPIERLEPAYSRLPGIEVTVREGCNGCGECVESCFMKAMEVVNGRAVIGEYCRACGRCAAVCRNDAITVQLTDPGFLQEAYTQIGARVNHK